MFTITSTITIIIHMIMYFDDYPYDYVFEYPWYEGTARHGTALGRRTTDDGRQTPSYLSIYLSIYALYIYI